MKSLILLAALLPIAAHAETIHLGSEICTGAAICSNVPNDSSAAIAYVDWAPQYKELTLSINGVTYASGLYAVPDITHALVFDHQGNQAMVSLTFSVVPHCAKYCVPRYTLTGGSIVR